MNFGEGEGDGEGDGDVHGDVHGYGYVHGYGNVHGYGDGYANANVYARRAREFVTDRKQPGHNLRRIIMLMTRFRFVPMFVLVLAMIPFGLLAQEQEHGHSAPLTPAEIRALLDQLSNHGVVAAQPDRVETTAAKSFTIKAEQFMFTVSPAPFVVNVGDVVTLNISVPSNDGSTGGHGFLMETFFESGMTIPRGQTKSVTFTATTPGTYGFICTLSTCGTGHSNMFGQMMVNAVQAPPPSISSITPTTGPLTGGTTVTIIGSNFTNGATVTFGSASATNVVVNSSTSISAITPAQAAGTVAVKVTNPDLQSATFNSFTFAAPPLAITSVSPANGSASGGTTVVIAGTSFQTGATVTVGGVPATVVSVDGSSISVVVPIGPADASVATAKDITVRNPDGVAATKPGSFTYTIPALAVTSTTPTSLLPGGGTSVTFSGAGFNTTVPVTVKFDGVPATSVAIVNAVTLGVVAPAHAAGAVDITIQAGGNTVTLTKAATYATPPAHRRTVKH